MARTPKSDAGGGSPIGRTPGKRIYELGWRHEITLQAADISGFLLDAEWYEDQILTRLQEAVTAGELAWCGVIGDEDEAGEMPKLPGAAVLLRRAGFDQPQGIDVTWSGNGIVEWSIFAGGTNLRVTGLGSGRRGRTGAYHAIMVITKYLFGWEIEVGRPMWMDSIDLAGLEQ